VEIVEFRLNRFEYLSLKTFKEVEKILNLLNK